MGVFLARCRGLLAVVARRRGLVVAVVVVVLVAGGAGGGVWWWAGRQDPLAEELGALVSDPVAALDYLAPEDGEASGAGVVSSSPGGQEGEGAGQEGEGAGVWTPSPAAASRWDDLLSRRWGRGGLEVFTRVVASGVSLRGSLDPVVAARAWWVAGRGVVLLAGPTVSKGDFTARTSRGAAVVVAALVGQLDAAASGTGGPAASGTGGAAGRGTGGLDASGGGVAAAGSGGGVVVGSVVGTVVYRLAGDQVAVDTVMAGLRDYHGAATARALDEEATEEVLMAAYEARARGLGLVEALVALRQHDDSGDDQDDSDSGSGGVTGRVVSSQYSQAMVQVLALAEAANRGLLPEGVFAEDVISDPLYPEEGTYPWYSTDEDGRPRVSLSDPPTQEETAEVLEWAETARNHGDAGEVMGSVANGFEEARRAGAERAAGLGVDRS